MIRNGVVLAQKPFQFASPVCSGRKFAGIQVHFQFSHWVNPISGNDFRSQER
jgi:hypothetical protein